MKDSFYDEEKEILNYYLDEGLFNNKKLQNDLETRETMPEQLQNLDNNFVNGLGIELIVRPDCNQSCDYCYIHQYGKELYPLQERVDKETILQNLKYVLDYVYKIRKVPVFHWELFAGDMFYDGLYFDILDVFKSYLDYILNEFFYFFSEYHLLILAPVNTTFFVNKEYVDKFEEYFNYFQSRGVQLILSYSTDGIYATKSREKRDISEEEYAQIFSVLQKFHFYAHPMIAPENIDTAIKNYDWWINTYSKYLSDDHDVVFSPMFLEVRNSNWTPEKIQTYIEFLNHVLQVRLKAVNNNIDDFAYHLFGKDFDNRKILPRFSYYDMLNIGIKAEQSSMLPCSLPELLHIQLNNLTIPICHRLTYPQFKGGYFKVEDNKITDIEPYNVSLYLVTKNITTEVLPKCANCDLKNVCPTGCLGAQYEYSGELFLPIPSVCNLFHEKYYFLLKKYDELGVFVSAYNQKLISEQEFRIYQQLINSMQESCRYE